MSKDSLRYRIGVLATGLLADRLTVIAFDGFLYPVVMKWCQSRFDSYLGSLLGLAVMTFLSYCVCRLFMVFYDWAKKDWLMMETVKARAGEGSRLEHMSRFLFLSLGTDPFITTISMRKGAYLYNGMSQRDWKIFIGSLVISNIFWAIVVLTSLAAFEDNLSMVITVMALLSFVAPVIRKHLTEAVS